MKRIGLSTFRKIYWMPLLVLFLLLPVALMATGATKSLLPLTVAVCLFLFWLVFGRRIAFRLVPMFVSTFTCPGCEEEIEAVGVWNCACGFHDHKERHVLVKQCHKCGGIASHIDCPRCTSTILLW
jgi:hypothetical protein